jgi:hypothetical protein
MKSRALSTALLWGLGYGIAQAASPGLIALNNGQTPGTTSSVVLAVVDTQGGYATQQNPHFGATFVFDLGVSYADLVSGQVSARTWNLGDDTHYAAFKGREVSFNLSGGYALDDAKLTNFDLAGTAAPFTDTLPWGLVTTARAGGTELSSGYNDLTASAGVFAGQGFLQGWIANADAALNGGASAETAADSGLSFFNAKFAQGGAANPVGAVLLPRTTEAHLYWISNTVGFGSAPGTGKDLGTLTLSADGVLTFTGTGGIGGLNRAPVANAQTVQVEFGTAKEITLTGSDADSGDTLTYSVVGQPSHGSLSGTAPALTYTPESGYSGADSFTFKINDGKVDGNTATVSITVAAAADGLPHIDASTAIDAAPGAEITLNGTGFGSGVGKVLIGGRKAKVVAGSWSDTQVKVKLPAGLKANALDVVLKTRKSRGNPGQSDTASSLVVLHAPTVSAADPASAAPKATITLTGSYFGVARPKVSFVNAAGKRKTAKVAAGNSDTSLTVTVPKRPAGSYTLVVKTSAGESEPVNFEVLP